MDGSVFRLCDAGRGPGDEEERPCSSQTEKEKVGSGDTYRGDVFGRREEELRYGVQMCVGLIVRGNMEGLFENFSH